MQNERIQLVGCGVLRREIAWLAARNQWPVDLDLLDSALHIDFGRLARELTTALARHPGQRNLVLYGTCHPAMDEMVAQAGAARVPGQNCVELLLGAQAFTEELSQGAFFLLEDWALRWDEIITKTFGPNLEITRDIFQGDRRYLLCLRTPCAGDFRAEAEEAGRTVGLPVRWRDVSLDHLESVLAAALKSGSESAACPK